MRRRADSSGAVHVQAGIARGAPHRFAGVEAETHVERLAVRPGLDGERPLRPDRGLNRVVGGGEGRQAGIPLGVHQVAMVPLDGIHDDLVLALEDGLIPISEPQQVSRRPLDIREQQRNRPVRQSGHRATPDYSAPGAFAHARTRSSSRLPVAMRSSASIGDLPRPGV